MRTRWSGLLAIVVLGFALGAAHAQAAPSDTGVTAIRYVTVQVKSYEDALAWYTHVLGLKKVEDRAFGPGRRWLVVAPEGSKQLGIVLEIANPDRADRVGKETNWVFEVADCSKFYDVLHERGVHFIDPPKHQPWGTTQAVFEDPYGNIYVAESHAVAATASHPESR